MIVYDKKDTDRQFYGFMDIFRKHQRGFRANNLGKTKEQTNHGSDEVKLMIGESKDARAL